MKTNIGYTAGKIWQVLKEKGEMDITQITKAVDEKSVVVYMALGWLAREDKINLTEKKYKVFVSLTVSE